MLCFNLKVYSNTMVLNMDTIAITKTLDFEVFNYNFMVMVFIVSISIGQAISIVVIQKMVQSYSKDTWFFVANLIIIKYSLNCNAENFFEFIKLYKIIII